MAWVVVLVDWEWGEGLDLVEDLGMEVMEDILMRKIFTMKLIKPTTLSPITIMGMLEKETCLGFHRMNIMKKIMEEKRTLGMVMETDLMMVEWILMVETLGISEL
jgi:hypothetical protein